MDNSQYTNSVYSEIILDHYKYPSCSGLRDSFLAEVKHYNPSCGDEIILRIHEDRTISYSSKGCIISVASASIMHELFEKTKKTRDEILVLIENFNKLMHTKAGKSEADKAVIDSLSSTLGDAIALSGVAQYPMRIKCALLAWMSLKDALMRSNIN